MTKSNSFKTGRYLETTEAIVAHETRALHIPAESSKVDVSDDMANLYQLEGEAAHLNPTKASDTVEEPHNPKVE